MRRANSISWLEKIRNSEEPVRRFWFYFFSSISMFAVVALWVSYMNLTIPRVGDSAEKIRVSNITQTADAKSSLADASSSGADNIIKYVGLRVSRGVALGKALVKDLLSPDEAINIDKKSQNFILEKLPQLEKQKLP